MEWVFSPFLGTNTALTITSNHEDGNDVNHPSTNMDLSNNSEGVYLTNLTRYHLNGLQTDAEKATYLATVVAAAIASRHGVRVENNALVSTDGTGRCR